MDCDSILDMKKIVFISGNPGKVEEVSRYLGMPFEHKELDLPEIQSLRPEEIVREKAIRAHGEIGGSVLVEDVSFAFHVLGRLPGTFIKWFEKELGSEGLCRLLDGKDRACTATVTYGLYDGETMLVVDGSMEGTVALSPRGANSFGWANVFIPEGMERTYAELTREEQVPIAMRRKALEKLRSIVENGSKDGRYL